MAFHLEPVVIAAIATGSLAVLLVLIALLRHLLRRYHPAQSAPSASATLISSSSSPYTSTPTPSCPSTATTLVGGDAHTPKGRLHKGKPPKQRNDGEEELMVVTYEEGLRKLGFTEGGGMISARSSDRAEEKELYPSDSASERDSPRREVPGRHTRARKDGEGRWGTRRDSEGIGVTPGWRVQGGRGPESTWLPSYYRREAGEGGRGMGQERVEESDLGYMGGDWHGESGGHGAGDLGRGGWEGDHSQSQWQKRGPTI